MEPFRIREDPSIADAPHEEGAESLLRSTFPNLLEFREGPHVASVARVAKLEALVDVLRDVPADALDFTVHSGGLETWLSGTLGDRDLAHDVAGIRATGSFGESLRAILFTLVNARYQNLAVLKRVE